MNTLQKIGLFIVVLGLGIVGAKLTYIPPTPDPKVAIVDKQKLYEMTYEWTMYKEIAIQAYAKLHDCSKEDAAAHLDNSIKYSEAKKFIADVEYREQWGN